MGADPKPSEPNPYNWRSEKPKHLVRREALLQQALATCLDGDGVFLLLGARGMGKSVFLAHLEAELRKNNTELEIISFSGPPLAAGPVMVADDLLEALLDGLVESAERRGRARPDDELQRKLRSLASKRLPHRMLDAYLDAFSDEIERIVLLYDELDRYADPSGVGRTYFNVLEDARKKLEGRLVVVAAGGLGLLSLKTVLGSSIFTRVAARKILDPFRDDELRALAEPFLRCGQVLSDEVFATLRMLSGGNLALATYGLQCLWSVVAPAPHHLMDAFNRFRDNNNDFGASIRGAIFGLDESEAPFHVWRSLKRNGGRLPRAEIVSVRQHARVKGEIEDKDILDMLRASGLIRMDDSAWKDDPIIAEIIPSILISDAMEERRSLGTLREQLHADLVEAMADVHRMTPAFYRPRDKAQQQEEAQLIPEAAFAAGFSLSLGGRGWRTELEAMSGAGFADIKARHPRFGEEQAIVEVKIWPRHIDTIHDQVTSYFAKGVTALATVVIADLKDLDWKDKYSRRCLQGKTDEPPVWKALSPPLEGYFEARWQVSPVEHFLLRLPSRS